MEETIPIVDLNGLGNFKQNFKSLNQHIYCYIFVYMIRLL